MAQLMSIYHTPAFGEMDIRSVSVKDSITGKYGDIFSDYNVSPTILGTGHYGCVRECQHKKTGEKLAVKTIQKSRVDRPDHIRREIEVLGSVDHPGIIRMVDYYEDDECVHIVTERCAGGELFGEICANVTDRGCLPEDEASRIIKSLLEAVQYLHGKNVVHRDIKPENILFERRGIGSSAKLVDFGCSRRHGPNDAAMTEGVGTIYYMSPDVLRGCYDRSCDLWAVGVVSYVTLCGCLPFNSRYSILTGNLTFEEDVWEDLSEASRDFVGRLLCTGRSGIRTAEDALRHPWVDGA